MPSKDQWEGLSGQSSWSVAQRFGRRTGRGGLALWAAIQVWQGLRLDPGLGEETGLARGVGRILSWNVDGWNSTLAAWLWDEMARGDIDAIHLQDTRWTEEMARSSKAAARYSKWGGGK